MSEKVAPSQEVTDFKDASYSHDEAPLTGWKYKARKLGPITFPYYASPKAQLLLVAFVCFLCPGMCLPVFPRSRKSLVAKMPQFPRNRANINFPPQACSTP